MGNKINKSPLSMFELSILYNKIPENYKNDLIYPYLLIEENKVKIGIVLSEIGIKHKINVTNQEIETELARICMQYPG